MIIHDESAAERFLDKCELPEDDAELKTACWIWTGAAHGQGRGYGKFWHGGRMIPAHRAAYLIFNGPIAEGQIVGHNCNNERCVNPFHLEAISQSNNIQYAIACGRLVPFKKKAAHAQ